MSDSRENRNDAQEINPDIRDTDALIASYIAGMDPLIRIREKLKETHGLQGRIAGEMNMSRSAFSRLIKGQTKMDLATLRKIEERLGLAPNLSPEARRETARQNASKMLDALGVRLGAAEVVEAVDLITTIGGVDQPGFASEKGAEALKRLAKIMAKSRG